MGVVQQLEGESVRELWRWSRSWCVLVCILVLVAWIVDLVVYVDTAAGTDTTHTKIK